MAKKPTVTTVASGYYGRQALNDNFEALRDAFDNTLSRDGSTPNAMGADLDMNSNDILNTNEINTSSLRLNGVLVSPADLSTAGSVMYSNKYTGDGSTVAYTLSYDPYIKDNTLVYIDGVYQNKDGYAVSGTTLTFSEAPPLNSLVEVVVARTLEAVGTADASAVTYSQGGTGAVTSTVENKLQETVSVKDFGAVGDGVTDDTAAIQAALDASNCVYFPKPPVEYLCSSSLVVAYNSNINEGYCIKGAGGAEGQSVIHFTSGSLKLHHRNHVVSDIYVTSDDDHGIQVTPETLGTQTTNASRSAMYNVRAEGCAKSGVYFEYCWLYSMYNCYFRFNAEYGIDGGDGVTLGCNDLLVVGCEIQGNGTDDGGVSKGTFGGFRTGRTTQTLMIGGAIEGNNSDGLIITDQTVGFHGLGVYFEKNGKHQSDRDVIKLASSNIANRAHDITLENCNFTPQNFNGTAQERAIDVQDIENFKVINPIFFALSGPVAYTAEPIFVRESVGGYMTGWVEGPSNRASVYTQNYLLNETLSFGYPDVSVFNLNLVCSGSADTFSDRVSVPHDLGQDGARVSAAILVSLDSGSTGGSGAQTGTIVFNFYKGTRNSASRVDTQDTEFPSSVAMQRVESVTDSISWDYPVMQVSVGREGTAPNDDLAADLNIAMLEVERYVGVIGQRK